MGEQLLADEAAETHLARFQPALRGRGACVNLGAMRVWQLPGGFLLGSG